MRRLRGCHYCHRFLLRSSSNAIHTRRDRKPHTIGDTPIDGARPEACGEAIPPGHNAKLTSSHIECIDVRNVHWDISPDFPSRSTNGRASGRAVGRGPGKLGEVGGSWGKGRAAARLRGLAPGLRGHAVEAEAEHVHERNCCELSDPVAITGQPRCRGFDRLARKRNREAHCAHSDTVLF